MKKTEQTQAGGDELREVLEENECLRAENRRLKVLLESFAIRPASSLPTPLSERRDKETPRPQSQPTRPLAPTRSIARVAEGTAPPVETPDRLSTRKEKIDLFRSLFRGREDVYAVQWENRKGKSGYSPACANEWNRPKGGIQLTQVPTIYCGLDRSVDGENEAHSISWLQWLRDQNLSLA